MAPDFFVPRHSSRDVRPDYNARLASRQPFSLEKLMQFLAGFPLTPNTCSDIIASEHLFYQRTEREMADLSEHEQRMLQYVERRYRADGRAPTVEEIRCALGMASKDHVARDLGRLERKGYLRRTPRISRGLELLRPARTGLRRSFPVSVVGAIGGCERRAAGEPAAWDTVDLTRDLVPDAGNVFALRVNGHSMMDALVNDGDIVVIQRQDHADDGDMVAVSLDGNDATLKRFYREGSVVRLQPENQAAPIYVDPRAVRIEGKVIAVIRRLAA